MSLFLARQVHPGGFGFKVLRTYLVHATDAQHAARLAVDAFPRPPMEFAAKWQVQQIPDPRAADRDAAPTPFAAHEVNTKEYLPFFKEHLPFFETGGTP